MSDMITITIDSARLTAALKRLAAAGRDLSPAMRMAAGIMADSVEENFEAEGRPKWQSLAASTLRQRAKEGSTGKILQRRGDLARSITRHCDATSATVGTNSVYAAIHQFGGQAGRGRKVTIPARPFLTLGDDDEEDIVQSFARFLGEAVG
jgi:phage virion morphogenesis protein